MTAAVVAAAMAALGFAGCARQTCEPSTRSQGIIVQASPGIIADITGAGACTDVRVRCTPYEFTSVFTVGCERYQLLPRRAGACTVKVTLVDGEIVTRTITIADHTADDCENANSFYADDPADDGFYVAPTRGDAGPPDDGSDADADARD